MDRGAGPRLHAPARFKGVLIGIGILLFVGLWSMAPAYFGPNSPSSNALAARLSTADAKEQQSSLSSTASTASIASSIVGESQASKTTAQREADYMANVFAHALNSINPLKTLKSVAQQTNPDDFIPVVNGSFETGPNPGPNPGFVNLAVGSTAITGWTVTRAGIDYVGPYWQNSDGDRSIDLNGSYTAGGIQQSFATTVGQQYNVNFDMAGNPMGLPTIKRMRVVATGQSQQSQDFQFDITGKTLLNMGWATPSTPWSFIADYPTTTIEFYSLDTTGSSYGPALDHIRSSLATPTPTNTPTDTPTPTRTFTITPTPSPTPTCLVPTPFAYPWGCTLSSPSPMPTARYYERSYYVVPTKTPDQLSTPTPTGNWQGIWYDLGRTTAQKAIGDGGPSLGISILDFGEPALVVTGPAGREWGTRLFHVTRPMFPLDDIKQVIQKYAQGFYKEVSQLPPSSRPHLILGVGTSNNYDPDYPLSAADYYEHGQQWGSMINFLSDKLAPLSPEVTIDAANDIEFGFADSDRTLNWARGFEEVTRGDVGTGHRYYVFGDCGDCYDGDHNPGRPDDEQRNPAAGNAWLMSKMVYVDWGNRAARPLPQIYYDLPNSTYPNQPLQWQWLSNYSATHDICLPDYGIYGRRFGRLLFQGTTADGTDNSIPYGESWQKLAEAVTGSSCTDLNLDYMQLVTPISYYPYYPFGK